MHNRSDLIKTKLALNCFFSLRIGMSPPTASCGINSLNRPGDLPGEDFRILDIVIEELAGHWSPKRREEYEARLRELVEIDPKSKSRPAPGSTIPVLSGVKRAVMFERLDILAKWGRIESALTPEQMRIIECKHTPFRSRREWRFPSWREVAQRLGYSNHMAPVRKYNRAMGPLVSIIALNQ